VYRVATTLTGGPMSEEAEAIAAYNLRLKVVQLLSENREAMEPFIAGW